jgi:GTP-binding protein
MGILIETLRREGFEISVSPPKVIFKHEKFENTKKILEPIEQIIIDADNEHCGQIIEKITMRKGEMKLYEESGARSRLIFNIPTRGLIGYPAEFLNDTRGLGILNTSLLGYEDYKGPIERTRKGSLISMASGTATAHALQSIEARGKLFVGVGTLVYPGMIIGEHSRDNDLEVNPVKTKQLTNLRANGKEESIRLTPPEEFTLEKMISYINGLFFF